MSHGHLCVRTANSFIIQQKTTWWASISELINKQKWTRVLFIYVWVCGYSFVCVTCMCARMLLWACILVRFIFGCCGTIDARRPCDPRRKEAGDAICHPRLTHTHTRAHMHAFLSPPPNVSLMRWISWMQQMCSVQSNALHLSVIKHTHTHTHYRWYTTHDWWIVPAMQCMFMSSSYMSLYTR